jgi:hypothetical protein
VKPLKIEYLPLSTLTRWPRNPKTHNLNKIEESFRRFGFTQPILIDEVEQKIVAGHGRLDALESLKTVGQDPPERITVRGNDWLVPVIRGVAFKDKRELEAYLIADNMLSEVGGWNAARLAEITRDLIGGLESNEDALAALVGTGIELDAVEGILKALPNASEIEFPKFTEKDADDVKMVKCPECGHEFPV